MVKRIIIQVLAFVCVGTSIVLLVICTYTGIIYYSKGIEINYYLYWFPIIISPFAISGVVNIILGVLDTTRPVKSSFSLQLRLAVGLLALAIHAIYGYKLGEYYNYILLIPLFGIIYFAYLGRDFVFDKNS